MRISDQRNRANLIAVQMDGTLGQAQQDMQDKVPRIARGRSDGSFPLNTDQVLPTMANLKARRAMRFRVSGLLVIVDVAAIATAYVVVSLLYLTFVDLNQLGRILMSLLPIFFVFNLNNYAYSADVLLDRFRSAWRGSSGLIWATLLMFLLFFFLKISEEFSRAVLGFGTVLAVILISVTRLTVADFAQRAIGPSPTANICIYDGVEPIPGKGEGVVKAEDLGLIPNPSDPVMLERLGRLALGVDGIVVHSSLEKRAQWAFMLKALDVVTELVTPELSELRPLAIRQRMGQASLVLGSGQLTWSQSVVKRAFDLVITLVALPVLAPLLALIALTIKLDSKGPVLFKQDRIGLGNRKFQILKFRTMLFELQDDEAKKTTSRSDPRVTRVGGFLRRTSLDELPQFLNVFFGDMSVVGPRPHAELTSAGSSLLWEVDAAYWHRHVVKPGITGLAQVRGHRGSLFEESDLKERLNADLEYVSKWSLTTDVKIIIRTLGVLMHKNAF